MPPKKTSQVHLVVLRNDLGQTLEVLEAYTTADAAEAAIDQRDGEDGLEVLTVDVKTEAAKKATKGVPSRGKAQTKKTKKKQDDDLEDEDENEDEDEQQTKVNDKKAAGDNKRKQTAQGKEGAFDGVKLLFTGTFTMDRKTCEATAVKHGATIATTLKQADLIVLGTKPGPKKLDEINEKGYKTVDEDGFHAMLKEGGGADAVKKKKT